MKCITNPKDSNVYRKHFVPGYSTPLGSYMMLCFISYKHSIPSGLLLAELK